MCIPLKPESQGGVFFAKMKRRLTVPLHLTGTEFHLTSAPSFPPVRHKTCEPSTRIKGTRKWSQDACKVHAAQTPANAPDPSWNPTSLLGCWPTPRGIATSVPKRATGGLQEALEDGSTVIHVLPQELGRIQKILISMH